jgi:imidazole glycerol-phosphate synthase subunit HisH
MIAVIDYKAGNTGSVQNALNRLGVDSIITADPATIKAADGVIFPGQGRAGAAMKELRRAGLDVLIPDLTQPFLGICLGMQLLAATSDEDNTTSLGMIPGKCRKFPATLKTPQLGWNTVQFAQASPLLTGVEDGAYFYFLNSYYFDAVEASVAGTTSYGFDFPSMVQKDNFFAVQFHPEKSGKPGQRLLKNFCEAACS